MPSLRIAYLSTHYPSVSHTFIQGEIVALEAAGVDVVRMALNAPPSGDLLTPLDHAEAERTFYVKAVPKATILRTVLASAVRHPLPFLKGAVRAVRTGGLDVSLVLKSVFQFVEAILVWHHCKAHDVSAIHAHFGQAPASVAMQAAAFGNDAGTQRWTWSVTIHGWHEFVTEDTSRLRSKVAAADLVVCISDFTRAQLLRLSTPADAHKVHIVRCGIDFGLFAARSAQPVSVPPNVVITARLSAEKGHLVLIEALALLRRGGFDVRATMIGTGPSRDDLEKAASRAGVADAVAFTGALPPADVAAVLRDADVFCLPTFAEGLPVSIMEAMAIGIPVVTTYISGIPELVIDGETGWVVPASNAELLADALRDSLTSPDRNRIIDAAARRVRERHDRSATSAQLAALLVQTHR